MTRLTVGLGVLVCSVAFATVPEHSVFTTPDGFVEILTDSEDLSPTEASAIAARIAAAYDFTRKEDRWADQTLLDPPLTVRVLEEVPDGILGRATAPRTFLIQLAYARTPTSAATIAHELTHIQDFRQLKKKKLAQYWLEGRANSNAFAYRARLVLGQNSDWKGRLARWTSDDARAVFAETVTSSDHRAQVEEIGTLWIEHLRLRFPDAGKVYFFKGDQYLRYDVKTDQIDAGFPKRMLKENWPGFPWIDGFDSAANWGDGHVYFF